MRFSPNDCINAAITNISTNTIIVAAPGAGRRIVVLGYKLHLDTDGEYTWLSAATALTGAMELTADTPDGAFCGSLGVLECGVNEALRLNPTQAANGWVRYAVERV